MGHYNQRRVPHIMRATKTLHHPSNFLFFDTETKDIYEGKKPGLQRHKLWFGYLWAFHYDKGKPYHSIRKRFTNSDEFFAIVRTRLSKDLPLYIFVHNTTFDLTQVNFWHQLDNLGIKVNYAVLEDPPFMLSLTWDEKRIIVLNTFNYWKCTVAQMGESLRIAKLPMPSLKASKEAWNKYCLRDVEIIANQVCSLIDFLNEDELGSFCISAPALAMSCFKRSFMKHDIYLHDREQVLKLERSCYYGGFVNNFYIGKSNGAKLYHTDINSLYPFVMLKNYPCKLIDSVKSPKLKILNQLGQSIGGCAYVSLESPTIAYPKRHNNRLCFVCGKFNTFLCGRELQRAYFAGHIRSIHFCSLYELAPVFKSFVEYFWTKRVYYKKQHDNVRDGLMKLLMNSLYGKFGMKGYSWRDFTPENLRIYYELHGCICPKRYLENNYQPILSHNSSNWHAEGIPSPIKLRYLGGKLEIDFPTGEHSESFCAIAAFVTSYARDLLNEYINIAGEYQTLYCDTDSLFVTEKGFKKLIKANLIDSYTLGKLKLEGESTKWAFYGPKDYIFDTKVALKGIRKNATKINDTTFEQDQFEGLKSVFKRGADDYIDIKRIRKTNKRIINKGVLGKDGWVTPLMIHE
jgi:DNA polymerase family B